MRKLAFAINLLVLLLASPAYAYIGPGAGAGVITVVLGVIGSVFLAFVAVLWYPFKRLFKRLSSPSTKNEKKSRASR